MSYAQIAGWGMSVPSRVVTNDDLVALGVETSDDWIATRTGIRERRMTAPDEATSDLAVAAARRALDVAAILPTELDLIVVATCTPDHFLPATACIVQDKLGATNAGSFDLNAVCSGFVYALSMASAQIESGHAQRVLIIGADSVSMFLDWKDRGTSILFGDGAGALVLEASEEPGVLSTCLGSDGSGASLLMVPGGGSRSPFNGTTQLNGEHHLFMDGKQVFRWATQILGKAAEKAIRDAGLSTSDIDLLIPHQANLRIIESAAKKLNLPPERVFVNVGQYGNTSAASIPIALCEAIDQGRVSPGDNIVLTSFGAGLSWGSAVIRWGLPLPVKVPRLRKWRQRLQSRWAGVRSYVRGGGRRARALLDRDRK